MRSRHGRRALSVGVTLAVLAVVAARPAEKGAHPGSASIAPSEAATGEGVDGCDILIAWNTYRGAIDPYRSYVKVKGLTWVKLHPKGWSSAALALIESPPPLIRTNGRIYNWKEDLRQERCDRDRRYRLKVAAPDQTGEPVRSNEPYAGTERWLYVPSNTGWTKKTTIDAGYLDWCVIDGTKCNKPYYPNGASTPILDWEKAQWWQYSP